MELTHLHYYAVKLYIKAINPWLRQELILKYLTVNDFSTALPIIIIGTSFPSLNK